MNDMLNNIVDIDDSVSLSLKITLVKCLAGLLGKASLPYEEISCTVAG